MHEQTVSLDLLRSCQVLDWTINGHSAASNSSIDQDHSVIVFSDATVTVQ